MTQPWMDRAACHGRWDVMDPPHDDASVREAKRICRDCPVLNACAAWALRTSVLGVAGGMTERERTLIRRDHHIQVVTPPLRLLVPPQCKAGHSLTGANVITMRDGKRACRHCEHVRAMERGIERRYRRKQQLARSR